MFPTTAPSAPLPTTATSTAPAAPAATAPAASLPSGHASLYVGDLDDDVTEAAIYEKFSRIGTIVSIRVCRDMISRKSLGYAYVNFATATEAEKAIDELNFEMLHNKQMRIMWSQRDPSLRKSGVGNLFIKNLDKSIVVRDLYDTFSTLGDILSCKIAVDEHGNSKGYGFVHFASKEAADNALKKLDGALLKDKKIFVGPFIARSQRSNQVNNERSYNNLFVKNFGSEMDDEKFTKMFEDFGEITSIKVEKDDQNASKGFGFVCFKEPSSASDAVNAKNGLDFNGRTLFVGRAMKKSERMEYLRSMFERKKADKTARYASGVNLYVKNLDDNIDDEALEKEFGNYGNITSVKVMRDQSGRSKGFGFVCFSYPDEATKAVTEMNGKLIHGKPLYVALAQRKEERRAHLQTQYYQRQLAIRNVSGAPIAGMAPQGAPMFPPNMNPQAFQQGAPPLNMYFPQGFANNPGALSAAQSFFAGMPQRNLITGMPMPRQGWPTNRPSAPTQIRPASMQPYSSMMRPAPQPNPQRFVPNQQRQTLPGALGQQVAQQGNLARFPGNAPSNRPSQVQFTTNARNIQQQQQPLQPSLPLNQPGTVRPTLVVAPSNSNEEQFLASFHAATPADQKQLLGERLYGIIQNWYPEQVGKLTGMLLEIDNRELINMIMENGQASTESSTLKRKVDSAFMVLPKGEQTTGLVDANVA